MASSVAVRTWVLVTLLVATVPWLPSRAIAQQPRGSSGAAVEDDKDAQPGDAPNASDAEGGEEASGKGQPPDIEELQRRLDVLAEEVERLRSGEVQVELTEEETRALGLAPSAAATYEIDQGVSIAGYGEMLFENFADETDAGVPTNKTSQFDFLRAIIYAGYRFNDKFVFNSELEVEHADEIFVEFAYVDYLAHENLGIRGGMLLAPMGLVNEFHEPTVFLGAERPVTEQVIIPSTWRENGGGIYGSVDQVSFRAYVMNGLNGANFSAGGLRGGRQKGSQAKATSMAFTGRVDVTPLPGVFVGASVYTGGSGQGELRLGERELDVQTTIVDVHGQAQMRGFDLRGLYARASVDDAAELNQVLGNTGSEGVAQTLQGGYLQVGYDVLSQIPEAGDVRLTPYVRWERVDTQASMPAGFERSLSTDNTYTTVGVELKPISNIVVKMDYAWVSNDADSGINQFNVGLGYAF